MALSARRVATEKKAGMYGDGGNLYLRVGPTGAKSWVFRYMLKGSRHDFGVGPVALVTLAEARQAVLELRRGLLRGIDPLKAKRTERTARQLDEARAMTFRQC